jgi:capsular polysaccharide biosynthesis protein
LLLFLQKKKTLPLLTDCARACLQDTVALLPALRLSLINPLVHSNMAELADDAFRRWLHWINVARDVDQAPVLFGRYPPGAILDGKGPYLVLTEDRLVQEQTGTAIAPLDVSWPSLRARMADAIAVDHPTVLACRHGEKTWGHWLLDILPKIVLAERAFPNRFRYAVPAHILIDDGKSRYAQSVRQSLDAYGIAPDRLLRIQSPTVYRFAALYDVADMVRDGMHPGVIQAMQEGVTVPAGPRRPLVSVMREPPADRAVTNRHEIAAWLAAEGAVAIDMARATFADQLRAFRDSDIIVGDLGSNLAASIYAPENTGIVTIGPAGWRDGFFVNLFQRQRLLQADIRGVAIPRVTEAIGKAPCLVDPAHVRAGLDAVREARQSGAGAPLVAGRRIARAPGPPVWTLRFGEGGNALRYPRRNFGTPEGTQTWSTGSECGLIVPHPEQAQDDRWLEVKGNSFIVPPHFVSRPLGVSINGVRLADVDIDELTHFHIPVPRAVLNARPATEMTFHHPICPPPHGFDPNTADERPLGFMFEFLALRRT